MSSRYSTDYAYPTSSQPPQPHHQQSYQTSYDPKPLYYENGEDRDEPFDVRADFDGEGPRWSERYGAGRLDTESYRPVDKHVAPSGYDGRSGSQKIEASREELVSVPVLGPEWGKAELHELSRRGQSEAKQEKRGRAWREWTRDRRGTFGVKWLTKRTLVFAVFAFCAGLAVMLYFLIPRAPRFSFYTPQPFVVDNTTIAFSRTPTNFSFTGNLNLLADATSSYLPVHFTNIEATLYDLTSQKQIATGSFGNHIIARKADVPALIPIEFSYSTTSTNDTTWSNMYNACGHLWSGTVRPDLKFSLELKMSIIGLTTHPTISTEISDVACPFELPGNTLHHLTLARALKHVKHHSSHRYFQQHRATETAALLLAVLRHPSGKFGEATGELKPVCLYKVTLPAGSTDEVTKGRVVKAYDDLLGQVNYLRWSAVDKATCTEADPGHGLAKYQEIFDKKILTEYEKRMNPKKSSKGARKPFQYDLVKMSDEEGRAWAVRADSIFDPPVSTPQDASGRDALQLYPYVRVSTADGIITSEVTSIDFTTKRSELYWKPLRAALAAHPGRKYGHLRSITKASSAPSEAESKQERDKLNATWRRELCQNVDSVASSFPQYDRKDIILLDDETGAQWASNTEKQSQRASMGARAETAAHTTYSVG